MLTSIILLIYEDAGVLLCVDNDIFLEVNVITKNSVIKIKAEIAFRKLADGSVTIISPVTDKMISINQSAAEIWNMIDGANSLKNITDRFIFLHENDAGAPSAEEIEKDVADIIKSFFERNLLEKINN